MDPQFNFNHFIFLLISTHAPCFFCWDDLNYSNCGQPFKCANKWNITYPFWNTANVSSGSFSLCGHPSFGLNCSGNAPILKISEVPYRIIQFDFFNYVITVAREDLYGLNLCNSLPINTTLNSTLFKIAPNFQYENLTLYYNCTDKMPGLPNRFNCESKTTNFFQTGNVTTNFTCDRQIMVPISEPVAGSIKKTEDLFAAARRGFKIKWSANNAECEECVRMGWTCVYYYASLMSTNNLNSSEFKCYTGLTKKRYVLPRDEAGQAPSPPGPARGRPTNDTAMRSNIPKKWIGYMGSNQRRIKLGLGFGGIGFLLVFVLLGWWYKERHLHRVPMNKNVEMFLVEHGSLYPKRYRYSDIKKITKSFTNKLGKGGYGSVYKGTLPNGCPVAVKVLNDTDSNDEDFINEVASIGRTSHVNIVSLVGFCYERKKRALLYEFMPNKSLDKFIEDVDTSRDTGKLYNIAVGVAKGLEYLHGGCNTSIIHFDIKPQNILLDEDFCPKISDFGLAKLCKKKQSILSVLGMRGTVGYIAPEVFSRNFGKVSHKSDVYSYGIMVLEMAGAKRFVEAETIQLSENYFPDKIYKDVTEFGHVMTNEDFTESLVDQEDGKVRKMFLIGFWCIQTIPSDRPSMSNVVEMLEGNLESIQIPPKPFLFNPKLMGPKFSPALSIRVDIESSIEEESLLGT